MHFIKSKNGKKIFFTKDNRIQTDKTLTLKM